jgi:hypothetical protein
MREAVEERAGEPLGAEHGRPLFERQIARDQRPASLVALAEDLEQQFGPGRREWHIAEFVDDQQLVAGVMKPTDRPFWQAAKPSPSAMWLLPVPLLPTAMMFSRRST